MKRVVLALAVGLASSAADAALTQVDLQNTTFTPSAGAAIPADARFNDQTGAGLTFRQALDGKPGLLVFVDYECQQLCGPMMAVVGANAARLSLDPQHDFRLIAIGLDSRSTPAEARAMLQSSLEPALAGAATFLTADAATLGAVTESVGYQAHFDQDAGLFAHATDFAVLTPDGHVSSVLPALATDADTMRLALVAAGQGRIGTWADHVRILCYGLDPLHGRYDAAVRIGLISGAAMTLAGLGVFIARLTRRRPA